MCSYFASTFVVLHCFDYISKILTIIIGIDEQQHSCPFYFVVETIYIEPDMLTVWNELQKILWCCAKSQVRENVEACRTSNMPQWAWSGSVNWRCHLVATCWVSRFVLYHLQPPGKYTCKNLRPTKILKHKATLSVAESTTIKSTSSFACWSAVRVSQRLSEKPDHPWVCVRLKNDSWFCINIYCYYNILIVYYIDILTLYYMYTATMYTAGDNCTYKLFHIEFLVVKWKPREGTGIVLYAGSRINLCHPLHTIKRYSKNHHVIQFCVHA